MNGNRVHEICVYALVACLQTVTVNVLCHKFLNTKCLKSTTLHIAPVAIQTTHVSFFLFPIFYFLLLFYSQIFHKFFTILFYFIILFVCPLVRPLALQVQRRLAYSFSCWSIRILCVWVTQQLPMQLTVVVHLANCSARIACLCIKYE